MLINEQALKAFAVLARTQNFSKAATEIGITQPALSIRIRELERELGTTLVKRMRGGLTLTDAGQELLQYWQVKSELEQELLSKISADQRADFGGAIRVAGSSSVMRPVVFKALANLIRKNPRVDVEFYVREIVDLVPMLHRGETDFVILNGESRSSKHESVLLGHERIVVVESSKHQTRNDVFLDADPKDLFTEKFFQAQGLKRSYRRSFLQDEFGILEGVALGIGSAVVHAHMIQKGLPIRVAKGFKPYEEAVILHFVKQPYYSSLHKAVIEELRAQVPKLLT
jgi:DNA-binding transcriptional LysR family regulator